MQSNEQTITLATIRCPKCNGRKTVRVLNPVTNTYADRQCFGCVGKGEITPEDARRNVKYAKNGTRSVSRKTVFLTARLFTDAKARDMEWPAEGQYAQLAVLTPTGTGYKFAPGVTADLVGQTILVPSLKANAWLLAKVEAIKGLSISTEGPKEPGSPPDVSQSPTQPEIASQERSGNEGEVTWKTGLFGQALVAAGQEPAKPKTFEEALIEYFGSTDHQVKTADDDAREAYEEWQSEQQASYEEAQALEDRATRDAYAAQFGS